MPRIPDAPTPPARPARRSAGRTLLATVAAVLLLRLNAAVAELALAAYTDGSVMPAVKWEAISAAITIPAYCAAAILLSRYPPVRRRRKQAFAAFAGAVVGALVLAGIIDTVMMAAGGKPAGVALQHYWRGMPNFAIGFTAALAAVAAVTWAVRFEQVRFRRERRRVEAERRYARAAFADVCRNVQPRFIAHALDVLERTALDRTAAERVLQRLARHVRLLREQANDRVTLRSEIHLLRNIERFSSLSFDIDVPEEILGTLVPKGLSAAVADLAATQREPLGIEMRAAAYGPQQIRVALAAAAPGRIHALHARLSEDERLLRDAIVELSGSALVITFHLWPRGESPRVPPPPAAPGRSPLARLLPLLIVLFASTRWIFFPDADPALRETRLVLSGMWLLAAPLLWTFVLRFASLLTIAGVAALTTLLCAASSVAAVEVVSLFRGAAVVLQVARPHWTALPRDAATITTVVAMGALLLVQFRKLAEERTRATRLHTLTARADISAFESNFHPHFLFNSLNGVLALLREDPPAAREMTARLAALVRQMLEGAGLEEWTVQEERALAEKYLWVMRARFGERVEVTWNVGRGIDDARIPRLLLQPLIENAVKHGIARRAQRSRIAITLRRTGAGGLLIAVENDTPAPPVLPPAPGGGLGYATARLVLLHGASCRPRFSGTRGSFRVEITLPLRR